MDTIIKIKQRILLMRTTLCAMGTILALLIQTALGAPASGHNMQAAYRLQTFDIPDDLKLEVSGLAQLPDGKIGIAIRKGEIWIADQTSQPESTRYHRFASGLHEPLGLAFEQGAFYTVQRTELTRIRDGNADGTADIYETVAKGWGVTGNYHEYAYGPKFDPAGDAWITLNIGIGKGIQPQDNAWRGWSIKVSPDGTWQPVSGGFRSPSGIGVHPNGDVFATDQQGNWFPTCPLMHLRKGVFHGHTDALEHCKRPKATFHQEGTIPENLTVVEAAKQIPSYALPALWFPYRRMGMSATDILWDTTEGRFGPFAGQAFVGEFTMSMILRVYLEKVDGVYQGACFRFFEGLQCGALRLVWSQDAGLIIGQTNRGWNSLGHRSYGMQKLSWTGKTPFEILKVQALHEGFRIVFTHPIHAAHPVTPESFRGESYTYHYHASYGSEKVGLEDIELHSISVSEDRRSVELHLERLREGYVYDLDLSGIRSEQNEPLLHSSASYTLNRIPSPEHRH
ncbi:hypothetical protein OAE97_02555 [Verrucomicrobia bacterium]|nr:hypothetical protein [Verrucomicrobiota bacterium]